MATEVNISLCDILVIDFYHEKALDNYVTGELASLTQLGPYDLGENDDGAFLIFGPLRCIILAREIFKSAVYTGANIIYVGLRGSGMRSPLDELRTTSSTKAFKHPVVDSKLGLTSMECETIYFRAPPASWSIFWAISFLTDANGMTSALSPRFL